jgi:hypothetical protein
MTGFRIMKLGVVIAHNDLTSKLRQPRFALAAAGAQENLLSPA